MADQRARSSGPATGRTVGEIFGVPARKSPWATWTAFALLLVLFPFSFYVTLPVTAFFTIWAAVAWSRGTPTRFGQDRLPLEILTAIVLLPVSSVIATVATSWAFYLWSQGPHRPALSGRHSIWTYDNGETGAFILLLGLMSVIEISLLVASQIKRQLLGLEHSPFEPGVDPKLGIAELKRTYAKTAGLFFPGLTESVAVHSAAQADGHELEPLKLRWLLQTMWMRDRFRTFVGAGTALAWLVVLLCLGLRPVWVILCFALLLVLVLMCIFSYQYLVQLDMLRLSRRAQVLEARAAEAEREAVSDDERNLHHIAAELARLKDVVEEGNVFRSGFCIPLGRRMRIRFTTER